MHVSLVIVLFFVLLLMAILVYGMALKTKENYIRILFIYLVVDFLMTVLSICLVTLGGLDNNLFLFHLFTPVEYVIMCLLFNSILSDRRVKKIIRLSIPCFIALSIYFSVFIQKIRDNNSYITIIESVLIICWTLLFLREVLLLKQVTVLHRYPLFWISVGILFYFTETLVIEGLLDYMIKHSMELARRTYRISFIFKYLLFLSLTAGAYYRIGTKKLAENQG